MVGDHERGPAGELGQVAVDPDSQQYPNNQFKYVTHRTDSKVFIPDSLNKKTVGLYAYRTDDASIIMHIFKKKSYDRKISVRELGLFLKEKRPNLSEC